MQTLSFSLLSATMIQNCLLESSTEIYFTIKVFGTQNDDKNEIFKTNKINNNFIKSKFSTKSEFQIYEPELSFIYIHLYDQNSQFIGRSVVPLRYLKKGLRNIPLYDNTCSEIEGITLFIHSETHSILI